MINYAYISNESSRLSASPQTNKKQNFYKSYQEFFKFGQTQ